MTDTVIVGGTGAREDASAAVSWPAIFAGGVAAAALSLLLGAFGAGIGLGAVSPWADRGVSSRAAGIGAGVYLVLVAVLASAVGGYVAGRLRVRWAGASSDEVYFRNTAHGFLAWAVATLLTAGVLASAAAMAVGGAVSATGHVAAATRGMPTEMVDSYVDRLMRPDFAAPNPNAGATDAARRAADRAELARLLAGSARPGGVGEPDRRYAAQLIAARTGVSQADAEQRVAVATAETKAAVDAARKAAAALALWITASLLFGALAASLAALEGGGLRDGTWRYR